MSALFGKKILIGITAGIAAYKIPLLVRLLIKAKAEVKVIMTPASKDFVTPLTLSTLSKNPVLSEFYENEQENKNWNNHVDLALWADLLIIAPATANTISKMANGTCDNLLLAVYLSAKCPVYFAPAMDLDMHKHKTVVANIATLNKIKNITIPAESGELASGLHGEGRMCEPENIVNFIEAHLQKSLPLFEKKVLITAGPTFEAIDPVRFIGNHSSGKMGFALAHIAAKLGAEVILISGPSNETANHPQIQRINVVSAAEMYTQTNKYFGDANIAIMAAAVADYTPTTTSKQKIKKKENSLSISLKPTTDILASMGKIKKHQFLVGFALETENELKNAKDKLKNKKLDLIVLNSLNDKGAGFSKNTNQVTLIDSKNNIVELPLASKLSIAKNIFNEIFQKL